VGIFTESVNWDEFALLHRAYLTGDTGELVGGGRPGLGTLLLVPFAAGCRNAIEAIVHARVLWTGIVVASTVAFWFLLRSMLPPSRHRWLALTTGVALWTLAPAFLRYSIQVRTDQPAILLGLLGGLALLASRRRPAWAAAAGFLLGVGFLFSQKLLYVAGLVGAMALGQLLIRAEWNMKREGVRAALTAAAFLLVIVAYRELMLRVASAPAMLPVSGAMNAFDYYRQQWGWSLYRAMLPTLFPQILGMACAVAATAGWLHQRGQGGRQLLTAWTIAFIGLVVLAFHAARFPYFYMVFGLFPAVIAALSVGPVMDRIENARFRALLMTAIWVPLVTFALLQSWILTRNTQSIQNESLAFVARNFPPDARGFQAQGVFICRADPDPFPVRFRQHALAEFGGPDGTARAHALIDEFRRRPVSFLIPPTDNYTDGFSNFLATRYVHYSGSVHVAGRTVRGEPGTAAAIEVVVPGTYVWRPSGLRAPAIEIDGSLLEPGDTVVLPDRRTYSISLTQGGEGMLVLSLPEPPEPDARPFYTGW
jgi:uncharacterized membrane protein (UPF0136 family)